MEQHRHNATRFAFASDNRRVSVSAGAPNAGPLQLAAVPATAFQRRSRDSYAFTAPLFTFNQPLSRHSHTQASERPSTRSYHRHQARLLLAWSHESHGFTSAVATCNVPARTAIINSDSIVAVQREWRF